MNPASSTEIETRIQATTVEVAELARRLATAKNNLDRSEQNWQSQTDDYLDSAESQSSQALRRDLKGIEANTEELRASAMSVARTALTEHAPAFLSADWGDSIWSDLPERQPGQWSRVGTLRVGDDTLPIALPISSGDWTAVAATAEAIRDFVHNLVARVFSAFDPSQTQVVSFDPGLNLDLAAFAKLRSVSAASIPPAITAEDELLVALDTLRQDITAVDDRLTSAGYASYWDALADGHPLANTTPLRLLIVADPTDSLGDQAKARLTQLRKLAADRGLLVVESLAGRPAADRPAADRPATTVVTLNASGSTVTDLPGVSWTPDPWVGDNFIRSLSDRLVERPRPNTAPTVDFEEIVTSIDDPWMMDATEGVEAVVGRVDDRDLVVRLRSENPPMPNVLVGGAVGQGKSNALLVLIHSLAASYSPAELEMVLVDLRDGVEFARLGPSPASPTWLPHVRALGLEFDPDYSIGVLRWVRQQMTDRSRQLKAQEATTLKQYRDKTGKDLPRLLIVIDEFQRLFEAGDEEAATAAQELDTIARTGRGFGVHLVLASQAITGIRGLATKSESIFGQFHNRLVLKNTPAESQAFLTAHNLAAAELECRGQVVLNDALGAIDRNTIGTVAYADPSYLDRLQIQLYQRGHGRPPSIFRASAFARWEKTPARTKSDTGLTLFVGLPIEVEAVPLGLKLSSSPNQAVAVVGSDRPVATAVLIRAVTTAAASLGPGTRLTLLDGDSPDGSPRAWVERLHTFLAERGISVERVARSNIPARLVQLGQGEDRPDLVVAAALDSVDLDTPIEPEFQMPSDGLRELTKAGPLTNTWTIGWWQSKSVMEEHLGYRATSVRAWAFAGVSRDDLTDIAGHTAREPSTSPRFVWFDRTSGAGPQRMVPFTTDDVIGEVGLV